MTTPDIAALVERLRKQARRNSSRHTDTLEWQAADALAVLSPPNLQGKRLDVAKGLRIGDKVEVVGKYEPDYRGQDLWVAGIRVHDSGEGLDITIAEQWPIPHRHWREYRGQTDGFRPEELRVAAAATPVPVDASGALVDCEHCQGNGEIVTDWERYMHGQPGDVGDEAVTECPDCNGEGKVEEPATNALASAPAPGEAEGERRQCSVCRAIVSTYPEGMCCHCHELPWPVAATPKPADVRKGEANDG